jgi:hypothetical protein
MPKITFEVDTGTSAKKLNDLAKALDAVAKSAKTLSDAGVSVEQISKSQKALDESSTKVGISAKKSEVVWRSLAKTLGGTWKSTVQYKEALEKLEVVKASGRLRGAALAKVEAEIEAIRRTATKETTAQIQAQQRLNEARRKGLDVIRAEENTRVRRGGGVEKNQVLLERHQRELDVALAGGAITAQEATLRYKEYEDQLARTAFAAKELAEEERRESLLRRSEKHDLELGGQARVDALVARKKRQLTKDVKDGALTQEKANQVLKEYTKQAKLAAHVTGQLQSNAQRMVGAFSVIAFGPLSGVGSRFIALNNVIRVFSENLSLLAAGLGIAGALVAGFFGALTAFRKLEQITKEIDEMQKAATRLGISLSEFQALDFAAQRSGLTGIERVMSRLSAVIGDASRDTGEAKEAFEDLSLSWKDLRKQNPADQIKTISDAFVRLKDSQKGISIARQLFGARESRAVNLFLTSGGGIQAMIDRARELGLVLDNAIGPRAEEFTDRLLEIRLQFKNLAITLATEFLPMINEWMTILVHDLPPAMGRFLLLLEEFGITSIRTTFSTREEIKGLQKVLEEGRPEFSKKFRALFDIGTATPLFKYTREQLEALWGENVLEGVIPLTEVEQGAAQIKVALLELHNVAKGVNSAQELERVRQTLFRMRDDIASGLPKEVTEGAGLFNRTEAKEFIQALLTYLEELEEFWIRSGIITGKAADETSKNAQKAANDIRQLINTLTTDQDIAEVFNLMNVHLTTTQARMQEAWNDADKFVQTLTKFKEPIDNFNTLSETIQDLEPALKKLSPEMQKFLGNVSSRDIEGFRPDFLIYGVHSQAAIDQAWRQAEESAVRHVTEFYQRIAFAGKQAADQSAQARSLTNNIVNLERELAVIQAQGPDRRILIQLIEEEERARNNAINGINDEVLARIRQQEVLARELVRRGRFQEAAEEFEDIFGDAFENVVNGAIDNFGDLWDSILQGGRDMLAQLVREWIFNPENFGFGTQAGAGSLFSGGFSRLFGGFGQSSQARNLLYKQQQETLFAIEANTRNTAQTTKAFNLDLGLAGQDLTEYFRRSGENISKAVKEGFADTSNLSNFQQFIQSDYVSIGGSIIGSILSGFAIGSSIAGLAAGAKEESQLGTQVGAAVGSIIGSIVGALFGGGFIGGGGIGGAGASQAAAGASAAGSQIAGAQLGGALGGGLLGTALGWIGGAFGTAIGYGAWPWNYPEGTSSYQDLWASYSIFSGGDPIIGAIFAGVEAYERNRAETSAAQIVTASTLEDLGWFAQRGITAPESPFGFIGVNTRRFSDYADDVGVFAQDLVDQVQRMDEAIALALTPAEIQAVSDALLGQGVFQEITRDPRNDVGALFIDRINRIMNVLGADPAAYGLTLQQTGGFFFDEQAKSLNQFIEERRKGRLAIDELSGNIFSEAERGLIALKEQWISLSTTLEKAGFTVDRLHRRSIHCYHGSNPWCDGSSPPLSR